MKTLMKIMSVLLLISGIILVATLINPEGLSSDFTIKVIAISLSNLLPILSIAICTYCLEKNDTNYLVRVIPVYLLVPMILSVFIIVFNINEGFLLDLYNFLKCTYLEILGLWLILVIKPNNIISTFFKYAAYLLFAVEFIIAIILFFNRNTLNLSNLESSIYSGSLKYYIIVIFAQIYTILILYVSNYAFSEKIELEAEDIDYDVVKEEARNLANVQMNNIYNLKPRANEPDRTASENGMMNINNQLNQNSNVGTVKEQAKEMNIQGSTLDSLMPLSNGPVVNQTIKVQEEKVVETTPQVEEKIEETTPPNLDIQEQMRLKAQGENQNINQ